MYLQRRQWCYRLFQFQFDCFGSIKYIKMKSFTALKIYLRFLGIVQMDSSRAFTIISNCVFFIIFIEHLLATLWFLLFNVQTFREFAESFFYVSYALLVLSWYGINFMHRQKYADNFEELDEIIDMSKFCTVFVQL